MFLAYLIAFSTISERLEVLQKYCWSTLIPRFGTMLIKKLLKMFAYLYSSLIKWSFLLRVIWIFDLALCEKSGSTLPQSFLLSLTFLMPMLSKYADSDLRIY